MSRTKKRKYRNKKVIVENTTFDSKKEANMYIELRKLESAGLVEKLILQPQFELLPRLVAKSGKVYRPMNYTADFAFNDLRNGEIRYRVLDAKGYKTRDYLMRKKLFAHKFKEEGLEIEEEL